MPESEACLVRSKRRCLRSLGSRCRFMRHSDAPRRRSTAGSGRWSTGAALGPLRTSRSKSSHHREVGAGEAVDRLPVVADRQQEAARALRAGRGRGGRGPGWRPGTRRPGSGRSPCRRRPRGARRRGRACPRSRPRLSAREPPVPLVVDRPVEVEEQLGAEPGEALVTPFADVRGSASAKRVRLHVRHERAHESGEVLVFQRCARR